MRIHVRSTVGVSPDLIRHARDQAYFAFGRFLGQVRSVVVTVARRGVHVECTLLVNLGEGAPVTIQHLGPDAFEGVMRAARRASLALERRLGVSSLD